MPLNITTSEIPYKLCVTSDLQSAVSNIRTYLELNWTLIPAPEPTFVCWQRPKMNPYFW